eukprot:Amastigsp_a843110_86.p4 type:complete len:101 gc:universal Amastigsp_a843110_86:591-893(+)
MASVCSSVGFLPAFFSIVAMMVSSPCALSFACLSCDRIFAESSTVEAADACLPNNWSRSLICSRRALSSSAISFLRMAKSSVGSILPFFFFLPNSGSHCC